MIMKIATWNVNSIRSRLTIAQDWLTANPVDVLCLQETKVIDADFPREPFEALGYHLAIAGQKSYNGVAIFSRQPLEDVKIGFEPVLGVTEFEEQKRVITGVFNNIRIVNLYVPNGSAVGSEKYEYKLAWLVALKTYLSQLKSENSRLCVCGDFNIALEDCDIYEPKAENQVGASPTERAALRSVLELGLTDAFRQFTQEEGHYSWWDYRQGGFQRDRGWRIDHIYLTPELSQQAINCIIDRQPRQQKKPSDHTPVIVELRSF